MKKEKIIVTGISGFIGSKLAFSLKNKGYYVIGIDKKQPKTKFYDDFFLYDISSADFKNLEIKYPKVNYIVHAAAQSGGYKSLVDPEIDFQWNCAGTFNIVRLASRIKLDKFIYLSSMAVYGNHSNISEKTTTNPISYYGASKLCGENFLKVLKEHNNIPFTILRLFATYGAGQDLSNPHQGILSIYLSQALESNTIKITGSKDRVRELVHVNDVIKVIESSLSNDLMNNKIYNVTSGVATTPEEIIKEISKALRKDLIIEEIEGYIGDQVLVKSSTQNELVPLGIMPKITLEEGIREFLSNL